MVPYLPDSVAFESVKTALIAGASYEIDAARQVPGAWLVELRGVDSREQADALRGAEVHVLRSEMEPLAENEFYAADLVGLRAVLPDGSPVGTVTGVVDYGAGDILVLGDREGGSSAERMIPLGPDVLVGVNLDAGCIVIAPPKDE